MIPTGNWNFGLMAPYHYSALMAPQQYPYPPAVPSPTQFRPVTGGRPSGADFASGGGWGEVRNAIGVNVLGTW